MADTTCMKHPVSTALIKHALNECRSKKFATVEIQIFTLSIEKLQPWISFTNDMFGNFITGHMLVYFNPNVVYRLLSRYRLPSTLYSKKLETFLSWHMEPKMCDFIEWPLYLGSVTLRCTYSPGKGMGTWKLLLYTCMTRGFQNTP